MRHPYLEARGHVYWYRRRIPLDLVAVYGNKREIRHSLKTADRKEAIRIANLRSVELDNEFEQKRKMLASVQAPEADLLELELSDEQIRRLCMLWQRSVLETDDHNRMGRFIETDYDDLSGHLADVEPALRQALARGQLDLIAPALQNFLFLCRVRVDEKAPEYRQLQYQFLQAVIEATEVQRRRLKGEVVQTEVVAPLAAVYETTGAESSRFDSDGLYALWESEVDGRPLGTTSAFKTASKQFGAFVGGRSMRELSRKDVIAFRDHLRKNKMKPKTIETKMAILCAMFQVAVDNGLVENNPASRIKVGKPNVDPVVRLPYGTDDLLTIFTDPIYSGIIPDAAGGEAACWLPALGLFTGARLEEMAQMEIADVLEDERYGWYLVVTDLVHEGERNLDDTKGVKTPGSRRRIPLHPALIEAGFLRYIARLKAAGHHRVFPLLQKDCKDKYSGNWSKWWSRYSRKNMGITSKLKVFHSLRHNFKHACREAGIFEEVHDAITGHRSGGVGRDYAKKEFPLSQLVKAMKRIRFPGIVLPVIEPMPQ